MKKKICFILMIIIYGTTDYLFAQKNTMAPPPINSTKEDYGRFLNNHPYFNPKAENENIGAVHDNPQLAAEFDFLITMDPALGYPPKEKLSKANQVVEEHRAANRVPGSGGLNWSERGPSNVGGRTRALMFDPNDSTNKKVWAGGVDGGLWYTNDITLGAPIWNKVNDFWSNLAITTIAFDPGNHQVFYVGTGEGWFNLDGVRGLGIWKTNDGGQTWDSLPFTFNNDNFAFIQKIVVTDSGFVLAATRRVNSGVGSGVYKSINGGASFSLVLGGGGGAADIEISADGKLFASLGIFSTGSIHKSTDQGNTWINIGRNGFPTVGQQRIEIGVAPSDAGRLYVMVQDTGPTALNLLGIYTSADTGSTWTTCLLPSWQDQNCGIPSNDMTRGQAFYDLIIAVDPNDANTLFVGGIDVMKSTDAGSSWRQFSSWWGGCGYPEVHADQHAIVYQPGSSAIAIFGNDGGVYYTDDADNTFFDADFFDKNNGYNVTQFYSCAIHPTNDYFLAGAQDNGTQKFSGSGIVATTEVSGGDGAFCFIDQDQPGNIQISSFINNQYRISTNNGVAFIPFSINPVDDNSTGLFINPSDYDDSKNILFTAKNATGIYRVSNFGGTRIVDTIQINLGSTASHIRVTHEADNSTTLFVGTGNGNLFRVKNANGNTQTIKSIGDSLPVGWISCVDVGTNNDELLVTYSSYGVSHVWYTNDGGLTWSIKADTLTNFLPDMPVRWAMFNPRKCGEVILATEVGVWATTDIYANPVTWIASNSGLANVRTDMFQYRSSDNLVIAATHGRGLYSGTFDGPGITSCCYQSQADTLRGKIYKMANTPAFKTNNFKYLEVDKKNNVWAGSTGFGVSILEGCRWDSSYNQFGNNGFLVRAMRRNPADSSIWVGMSRTSPCLGYLGGIYAYSNKSTYTRHLPPLSQPADGLSSLMLRALDFNKRTKENWAGCTPQICEPGSNGGLAVLHNGAYDELNEGMPPNENADRHVTALTSASDGTVYIGVGRSCKDTCIQPYILVRDSTVTNPSLRKYTKDNTVLPFNGLGAYAIRALYVDKSKRLWVGGELNGIGVMDSLGNWVFLDTTRIPYKQNALLNFDAITEGSDSSIYFGTSKGMLKFRGNDVAKACNWKRYVVSGISSQSINSIRFDFDDVLWLATNEGIFTTTERPCLTAVQCGLTDVSCNGFSNGSVCIGAIGGVPPYSGDLGIFSNLPAGTRTYTVRDSIGTSSTISVTINQPPALVVSSTNIFHVTCPGGTNGSVFISASGGTPPYGGGFGSHSGLSAGQHTFNITDSKGCNKSVTVTITQPAGTPMLATATKTDLTCYKSEDGSVTVNVTGGIPPYISSAITFIGASGTEVDLTAGFYSYTVIDNNGCTSTASVTVNQPDSLQINSTVNSLSCNGNGSDASAFISVSGGTPPYTGNTGNQIGLTQGPHTWTVTDDHGCTASKTDTISFGPAFVDAGQDQAVCFSPVFSFTLTGSTPPGNTPGRWIDLTGSSTFFPNDSTPSVFVSNYLEGVNTYAWVINCGPLTISDVVNVYAAPLSSIAGITISSSAPVDSTSTSIMNITICQGDSITFTRSGGEAGLNGFFKWYENFCDTRLPGFDSIVSMITVAPTSNTVYYTGAQSFCNVSQCLAFANVTVLPQKTWYLDFDGDGFGDIFDPGIVSCLQPPTLITNPRVLDHTDCNDNDAAIHATQLYYVDADGDGFGSTASSQICSLVPPVNFSINSNDCNDTTATVNPAATEICDSIDNDCDGHIDEGCGSNTYFADVDGDGFGNPNKTFSTSASSPPAGFVVDATDCMDSNFSVHPGAVEVCNNLDDNCNGTIDEGFAFTTFFSDTDGDGFGNPSITTQACIAPSGFVSGSSDCNDTNAAIHPGNSEVCNGIDDNCNGFIDEGVLLTFYRDADGDGFGNTGITTQACTVPSGYVTNSLDCNDGLASIHPGALEICNGIDENCDGTNDEGVLATFFRDVDGDGFGNLTNFLHACSAPSGYVSNSTDCNDGISTVHPGATEVCNGIDDNCNGQIDEGAKSTFYRDADGDGFGNNGITTLACSAPSGFVANNTDCNDGNAAIHPDATEICDSIDNNCNGLIDDGAKLTFYRDADRDGFGNPAISTLACSAPDGFVADNTDCNDGRAATYPGATESCNGIDDNCNGAIDEGVKTLFYGDADGDGFGSPDVTNLACTAIAGYVSNSGDCNDDSASVHPGATEVCNGIDDDCDGVTDTADCDIDGDGFTLGQNDCDDLNPDVYPGAAEDCNGIDDNCNGLIDEGCVGATMNLRVFIQGLYSGNGLMYPVLFNSGLSNDPMACDSITVEFHDALSSDAIAFSIATMLRSDGHATISLPFALSNHSYYLAIRHRNTIAIWSRETVLINSSIMNFDFTSP